MGHANGVRVIARSAGLAILLIALSASTACRRDAQASAQSTIASAAALRTVTILVDGMICQVCAGRVKSTLKAVHGVESAEISLEKRNAVVRYEADHVSPDRLIRAVNELGYKAGGPTPVHSQ